MRNGPLRILSRLRQSHHFNRLTRSCWPCLTAFLLGFPLASAFAQVNVLNVNYDSHQTGANLLETSLTPQINWTNFGKAGTDLVDGQGQPQPLWRGGVAIGVRPYNVH